LYNFDILSLKFYEKLNITESSGEDETGSTKKDLDNSISSKERKFQSEKLNVARALKQYEIRKNGKSFG